MSAFKSRKAKPTDVPKGFPVRVRIYQCARPWQELSATPVDGVRHCDACNQMVHQIKDADGLKVAIVEKRCVRIEQRDGGEFIGEVI